MLAEPGRRGQVGPGDVRDGAALHSELVEDVAPAGEEPLLIAPGLHTELRSRDAHRGGERVALLVEHRAQHLAAAPRNLDQSQAGKARR